MKDQSLIIEIGDKLKVYCHEKKVLYEAKVLEISTQQKNSLYLVHYTGWSPRYDEWLPKEHIAENLTNNKSIRRAKTGGSSSGNSNFSKTSDGKSGGSINSAVTHPSKILFKRGRGSSRGESQPPRSTAPSSVPSNSSRTKSPASPALRRNTRGYTRSESCSRYIVNGSSNNTDISSIHTATDTDSDEPVKKPPWRKICLRPRSSKPSTSTSNPSSEEESLGHSSNVKGRDYDLIQIRSELKGFKELKSPSFDLYNESNEKKFEFSSSIASNTESGESISQDIPKVVTSDSKISSDKSSESDSYGDDDSFSDKPTTLENLSEKLQEKFKAGKLYTDIFKNVTSLGAVMPPAAVVSPQFIGSVHTDLVDKVATLKASGIELISKNSLADSPEAPTGKMTLKELCEPLKQMEKDKLREKETTILEKKSTKIDRTSRLKSAVVTQSTANAETAASKESLSLLLCEETIPGRPTTPLCPGNICGDGNINLSDNVGPKKDYEIMFVSPQPTTSDIKSVPMDIETIMVTSTINVAIEPTTVVDVKQKIEPLSPQSSARVSLSHDDSSEDIRKREGEISLRKRRRSKKLFECEVSAILKRRKGTSNTTTGSDCEDNSEYTSQQRPSKPCQYNFLVQLDPSLNSHQRITILNKKIQELRKTYNNIKAELASIDRRQKTLRRREREREQKKHLSKIQHY